MERVVSGKAATGVGGCCVRKWCLVGGDSGEASCSVCVYKRKKKGKGKDICAFFRRPAGSQSRLGQPCCRACCCLLGELRRRKVAASSGCLVVRHSRRCVFLLSLPVVRISPAAGFLLDGMLAVFYHPCARHGFELAGEVRRKEKKNRKKEGSVVVGKMCWTCVFWTSSPFGTKLGFGWPQERCRKTSEPRLPCTHFSILCF